MYELSLFTGAGGGILGSILLGWKTIGYVEINDYCQSAIKQRIEDGIIHEAPIFSDIKTFISAGYARSYQGMVDVITAGFPCQPYSVAGKGLAENDPRNMWPSTLECIRIVRPALALLENVPGLLSKGYIRRIYGDLAEAGYDARWCVLGADDCGANHRRKRWWLLAYANGRGTYTEPQRKPKGKNSLHIDGYGEIRNVAYPERISEKWKKSENRQGRRLVLGSEGRGKKENIPYPAKPGLEGKEPESQFSRGEQGLFTKCSWWSTEPELGRVAHGVAHRVDRLKAIGNGQVSLVVKTVWRILTDDRMG